MSKTLEKILEDELFKTEELEGLGSLSIKNTSKDTKMQVNIEGNSIQNGEPSLENKVDIKTCGDNVNIFDGKFRQGGWNSISSLIRCYSTQELNLDLGDYTLSTNLDMTKYRIAVDLLEKKALDKSNSILKSYGWTSSSQRQIKIEENGFLYIALSKSDNSDISIEEINSIQDLHFKLEKGTQKTPWNPYSDGYGNINFKITNNTDKEQNITIPVQKPFRAIENHKDTFIRKNGKWYEKHFIKRRIFDGTEGFYLNGSKPENNIYQYRLPNNALPDLNITPDPFPLTNNSYCNYLKKDSNVNLYLREGFSLIIAKQVIFNVSYATLEEFTTKLKELHSSGKPLYIDYLLAEPEEIECNEEQTKILNKLQRILSYEDITNIICTDEVECNFKVTAKVSKIKELEEQINAQIGE